MNRRSSIAVDILFLIAVAGVAISIVAFSQGEWLAQIYAAVWACFSLLMAVLICVHPGSRK